MNAVARPEALMTTPFEILDGHAPVRVDAQVSGGRVALDPGSLERALGWKLRPEGLCRGAVCVPVRDGSALAGSDGIDLAGFAAALGRPLALDLEERAAALGTAAAERRSALASLAAPDFTLPDLGGRLHSLSEQRGKKVLLVTWASW
jgi:hypothetical protein